MADLAKGHPAPPDGMLPATGRLRHPASGLLHLAAFGGAICGQQQHSGPVGGEPSTWQRVVPRAPLEGESHDQGNRVQRTLAGLIYSGRRKPDARREGDRSYLVSETLDIGGRGESALIEVKADDPQAVRKRRNEYIEMCKCTGPRDGIDAEQVGRRGRASVEKL
ncbi:hypothetical protein AJ78_07754 [Emergomyces pasteurianus Ep9510]|uniref:Uncharacterized protein n=1 Tax=Emergomyces pasteurianus Ep9510 TaxID=1447872 RepID=A0A1J9P437_9EURO|nr:hypothetical protein AJ78_07754 [Emergomyces pasteurianus Ep9510]